MLGSARTMVQAGQTSDCFDADFLPFGQEVDYVSTCGSNYKFEGKERDTETGNDDFGARYYRSALGRWLSPDWSAIPAPVPYANLTNPQTLNLYAMVSDNPETFADLDGHCSMDQEVCDTNPSNGETANQASTKKNVCNNETGKCDNANANVNGHEKDPAQQQVPASVKAAIMASVSASNSPTADDKKGGFHEEGGDWVTTTDDKVVPQAAVPGKYAPPGQKKVEIDPGNSVNPVPADKVKSVDGTWHVHPRGGGGRTFKQPPSPRDIANAVAPINIVVGAGNKSVYFYNSSGVVKEMSLKDFMKEP